jgi:hypothetical protein
LKQELIVISSLFTWFLTRVTRRVALLKQELIVISVHLSSFLFFSGCCFSHLTSKSCIWTYLHGLWLCHRLPGIRSVCRGHYLVLLSSSVTFHPKSNMTCTNNGTGTDCHSGALEVIPVFSWVCIDQSFFDLNLQNVSVIYSSFFFWWVHCPYNRHNISMLVQGRIQPEFLYNARFLSVWHS